jgi:uncharacterized protein (TIGR00251 family)
MRILEEFMQKMLFCDQLPFLCRGSNIDLFIFLTPKASFDQIKGIKIDQGIAFLSIRVTSPPVDNKANDHLIDLLAKFLNCKKSNLSISKGKSSRKKTILICGMSKEEILKKIC